MQRLLVRVARQDNEIGPGLADMGQRLLRKFGQIGRLGIDRQQSLLRIEPRSAVGQVPVYLHAPPRRLDVVLRRQCLAVPVDDIDCAALGLALVIRLRCDFDPGGNPVFAVHGFELPRKA